MSELGRDYDYINRYGTRIFQGAREIQGRGGIMRSMLAAFDRPELSNVLLLGDAGSGKSAIVESLSAKDTTRVYYEVDLAKMLADISNADDLAATLKAMFAEAERYSQEHRHEIVLFMDEFHQIVQMSPVAVEAMKPLLAESGRRGIRVIAATTYDEFKRYIAPNQPLVERLQRINVPQANRALTMAILKGMAETYGIKDEFPDDHIFDLIYTYTERYIPANAQPRKSLLVLDAMVGWNRLTHDPMDTKMLAKVIYESSGVNVAFNVDATRIRADLDRHVLSQRFASKTIADRLQICVAGLNDPTRPMSSFLFVGTTGTGKTETAKTLAHIIFEDSSALVRIDMSEYVSPDSVDRFRREVTAAVWARPFCILLLDEIEKACGEVIKLMLQLLDDGRLSDANERTTSFVNCYVIMTTNVAATTLADLSDYRDDETAGMDEHEADEHEKAYVRDHIASVRRDIMSASDGHGNKKFPPEFLGRIDSIVMFQGLDASVKRQICRNKLGILKDRVLKQHNIVVEFVDCDRILTYIVDDLSTKDTTEGGARSVIRNLDSEIVAPLAKFINEHPDASRARVSVEGDLRADHYELRTTKGYVQVQ